MGFATCHYCGAACQEHCHKCARFVCRHHRKANMFTYSCRPKCNKPPPTQQPAQWYGTPHNPNSLPNRRSSSQQGSPTLVPPGPPGLAPGYGQPPQPAQQQQRQQAQQPRDSEQERRLNHSFIPAQGGEIRRLTLSNNAVKDTSLRPEDLEPFHVGPDDWIQIFYPDGREQVGVVGGVLNGSLLWVPAGEEYAKCVPTECLETLCVVPSVECPLCLLKIMQEDKEAHMQAFHPSSSGNMAGSPPTSIPPGGSSGGASGAPTGGRGQQQSQPQQQQQLDAFFGSGPSDGQRVSNSSLLSPMLRDDHPHPSSHTEVDKAEFIGGGAQGQIWRCTWNNPRNTDRFEYILKEIAFSSRDEAEQFVVGNAKFMELSHPHLIRYYSVKYLFADSMHKVLILMPYFAEKDLATYIAKAERISENTICSLGLQVAQALDYLHSLPVPMAHRDVKPENVLMYNNNTQVVLMDLDASKEMVTPNMRTCTGTTAWMAPEVINSMRTTTKSDMWSLGLVLYVLAVLPEFPMLDYNGESLLMNSPKWPKDVFLNAVFNAVKRRGYSDQFGKILIALLTPDDESRMTAAMLCDYLADNMTQLLLNGIQ